MFKKFKYEKIELAKIRLNSKNPRIVTQQELKSQPEILRYFFDHENLEKFIKKIASEGKNHGAERLYIIKDGKDYVVIEGNTRIAAYKVITGIMTAPEEYASTVPHISASLKESLMEVDCTVAPDRDSLLSIMANSHFRLSDKARWGFLGSRKAVYDEWRGGKNVTNLPKGIGNTPTN